MKKPLWVPSEERIKNANMTKFIEFVNKKNGKDFKTYDDMYQWSVDNIPDFWDAMWKFAEIKASKDYHVVVDDRGILIDLDTPGDYERGLSGLE